MMLALVLEDLVDGYFDTTDALEDGLEAIEDRIFSGDVHDDVNLAVATVPTLRRSPPSPRRRGRCAAGAVRRAPRTAPPAPRGDAAARGALGDPAAARWSRSTGDALVICRDTFDKLLRAIDLVDELRELVGNAVEAHLAVMSNQMNLVMKQLTAWGSIVFGATLIAGIYGMNFAHMPELDWHLGYPFALGLMAVMSVVLYRLFKRNNWL